jgi:hypothetical protein
VAGQRGEALNWPSGRAFCKNDFVRWMPKHPHSNQSANQSNSSITPAQLVFLIAIKSGRQVDQDIQQVLVPLRTQYEKGPSKVEDFDLHVQRAIKRFEKLEKDNLEATLMRGPLSKLLDSKLCSNGAPAFILLRVGLLCVAKTRCYGVELAGAISQIQKEDGCREFIEKVDPTAAKVFADEFMECIKAINNGLTSKEARTSRPLVRLLKKVVGLTLRDGLSSNRGPNESLPLSRSLLHTK